MHCFSFFLFLFFRSCLICHSSVGSVRDYLEQGISSSVITLAFKHYEKALAPCHTTNSLARSLAPLICKCCCRRETLRVLQLQEALLPLWLLQFPHQQQEVHPCHLSQWQTTLWEYGNPEAGCITKCANPIFGFPWPHERQAQVHQASAGAVIGQSDQN